MHVRWQWLPPLSRTTAVDGGGQQVEVGALAPKSNQRPLPTLPEQYDSDESTAGGASEWFGMDLATEKTVSGKFIRYSDGWDLPGVCPRPFEPNRSSICSSNAHILLAARPSTCVPSATRSNTMTRRYVLPFLSTQNTNLMLVLTFVRCNMLYDDVQRFPGT